MGLADDIINTSPFFKLFIQILSGIILINFGIFIELTPFKYCNYILTVLWMVGIMNSLNMLDNMDAIATVVSLAVVSGIIINIFFFYHENHVFFAFSSIAVLSALSTFLLFNWKPAKMYMGDNGSQFLGSFLGTMGIIFFWNAYKAENEIYIEKQIIAILFAFIVPIIDATTVTINRILNKKSPFTGGKDHTTHYLSYLGLSEKSIALLLFGLSLLSMTVSLLILNLIKQWNIYYTIIFSLIWVVCFTVFFTITKMVKPKPDYS